MASKRFISIGKITSPHGIKGALKLHSYAESTDFFNAGEIIRVQTVGGESSEFTVNEIKPHKKGFLLFLKEIDSLDQAQVLVNAEILIERGQLPETDEGTFYWADLIGLEVYDEDRDYIGKLDSIIPTGSNDVFVIRDKETETLVPALESVVKKVDLKSGVMHVRLPDGL